MSSALAPMTREEIVRGLVQLGVPRAKAERQAGERLGTITIDTSPTPPDPDIIVRANWPLTLTLPWSYLVSDNRKYGAQVRRVGKTQGVQALLVMQPGYRDAKGKIRKLARDVMGGDEVTTLPLRLEARVWMPDTRIHDVANFAKCVHDALIDAVYADDSQLHDVRWIRAGVDVDRPRAEITISPIAP